MSKTTAARAAKMRGRLTQVTRKMWKQQIRSGAEVLCAICGESIPSPVRKRHQIINGGKGGLTVDHILPLGAGGEDRFENLQPAHNLCNSKKADNPDYAEAQS